MPDTSLNVTLTVDGLEYAGWTSVEISAGLERQARDFSVGITSRWPGQAVARPIKPGARCEVRIGGDLVLTGYVFATPISYDDKQVTVSIKGRSLTADLVDCAAINRPGQWKGQTVQTIVRAIAGTYGLQMVSETEATTTVADHSIQPGETAFKSIDRLLTLFRIFSTDDAQGRVVLAKPGSAGQAFDRLEVGRNVKSGGAQFDFSKLFSQYRVIGQHAGSDDVFGSAASEVSALSDDDRVLRKRVLVIQEQGQLTPALAASRAKWEAANRISKALTASYVVQGWRQSNGALWLPNMLARVVDPVLGFNRDMLITEVKYSLSQSGTLCSLQVAPPAGFEPEARGSTHNAETQGDEYEHLMSADWKNS